MQCNLARHATLALVQLVGLGFLLVPTAIAHEAPVTIDEIERIWAARQAKVRNFWIEYDQEMLAGARTDVISNEKGDTILGPPEDTRFTRHETFAVDGNNWRYEFRGALGATQAAKEQHVRHVTVSNEVSSKHLAEGIGSAPVRDHPFGTVRDGLGIEFSAAQLWPIRAAYRSLDFGTGTLLMHACTLKPDADRIDGSECVLLEYAPPQGGPTLAWLDPLHDFLPVRIQMIEKGTRHPDGHLSMQMDIEYQDDATVRFAPHRWKWTLFVDSIRPEDKGRVMLEAVGTLTSSRLNSPIDPKAFELEFPVGTEVMASIPGQAYLVQEGGRRREILEAERRAGLTHAQLMGSAPGELVPAVTAVPPPTRYVWMIAGGILALLALTLVIGRSIQGRLRSA